MFLGWLMVCCCSFVNNVLCAAFSLEGALRFDSAFARWVGFFVFRLCYLLVVFLDDLRHFFGATVA